MSKVQGLELAEAFLTFVNASSSPFHAVDFLAKRLSQAGFVKISENTASWNLTPNGKYYFTRNASTLLAFSVGGKYASGNGFNIIGAHTDSPVLKVKPTSAVSGKNFLQVGVEPYGGGLWHTWFDRDLSVAGRVFVSKSADANDKSQIEQKLVRVERPILRIPTLAIHLDRSVKEGFKFNDQTHLMPILSSTIKAQLEGTTTSTSSKQGAPRHHSVFLELLASELGCEASQIVDFELSLYDTQPSAIGGLNREWIFSPRLDNLVSSFCSIHSLIDSLPCIENESRVNVAVLFDNEEVGSASERGAASTLIEHFIRRVTLTPLSSASGDALPAYLPEIAFRRSFVLSADMAHAVHPNYIEKHEPNHQPIIHNGPVLKNNANQRYATSAATGAVVRTLAQRNNVPIQEFVVRNDSLCGSTIGPILSTFGLRTADVGNPQLSMHSIREMCGVDDLTHAVNLFRSFYEQVSVIDDAILVD